ncbi:MAG: hypothetical protein HYY22_00560 [Thaumarchaeota archaeon]|nr:hypothetical protein [Nitrososphaerota archaeon]
MEIAQHQQQPQSSSKVVWESKIKGLEDEKSNLQQEISKISDLLAVAELEKKFRALEEEVLQLRTTKIDLEGQLVEHPKATTTAATPATTVTAPVEKQPAQTAETARPAPQNRPSNEAPRPLRRFAF